jgi:uncharacterized membrane protein YkoI
MRRRLRLLLCLLLLLGSAPLAPVPAAADNDQDRAREAVQSGQVRPLNQILKSVRRQYKGEVLDAQLFDFGGQWVYQVRLLTKDGQVLDIAVDGRSGQIIGVQGGN